jgi:hypothetical protein
MKPHVLVPVIVVLALGGCGGGSSSEGSAEPTAQATAVMPSQSPTVDDTGNCATAAIDGTTSNAELQQLAYDVYASLQCGTGESLGDQLKALADDPEFTSKAKAAGATVTVDSAAGGTVMSVVVDTSGCNVTVLDSADAKTMSCLDL